MSDYKKGEWSDIFDAIYYNFINNNIDYLKRNYATSRQVAHWNKKSSIEKKNIIDRVNAYITKF